MTVYVREISPVRWLATLWHNHSFPREVLNITAVIDVFTPDPHRQPLKQTPGESREHFEKRVNDRLLGYEREWGKVVPDVIYALLDNSEDDDKVCFIWAEGPMETGELPAVFPYMTNRYHIEGITFTSKIGYCHSWISFEYHYELFMELMECQHIDLEYTRLYVLIFNERHIDTVVTKRPPRCIDLGWVISHSAIAMSFYSHFEGGYIAGERTIIDAARKRVVDRLRSQNVDVNIMESEKS